MAKYTYKQMEQRKSEGKLFVDTPKGLIKATFTKFLVGRFNRSWPTSLLKRYLIEKIVFGKFGKSWIEPPFNVCVEKTRLSATVAISISILRS